MTPDERHEIREPLIAEMRAKVEEAGGSIADGLAILLVAVFDLHTSMCIAEGATPEMALARFKSLVDEHYRTAFDQTKTVFRSFQQ